MNNTTQQEQSQQRRREFVRFALEQGVLRFGQFETKSGRLSPYFFNAGLFNSGKSLGTLAQFYADTLVNSGVQFDMLFGPAYKGISLAAATSIALANHPALEGRDVPYAFDRKEAKAHGEGGVLVGAPLEGKVVIIDDVITAGTSVRHSVEVIESQGATPAAVLIAMDRMEKGGNHEEVAAHSAVQEVEQKYGLPVVSIASLNDIMSLLEEDEQFSQHKNAVLAYREKYGA